MKNSLLDVIASQRAIDEYKLYFSMVMHPVQRNFFFAMSERHGGTIYRGIDWSKK